MTRRVLSVAILAVLMPMAAFPALAQAPSVGPDEPLDGDQDITRAECERFNQLYDTEIDCGGLPKDVGIVSRDLNL